MSRSRPAKPSKPVKTKLPKKKSSQVKKKTAKQAVIKHGSSGKAVNPGKLKQLSKRRDGKKETDGKTPTRAPNDKTTRAQNDKTPTRAPSLLTRAGAARMNQDRNQVLFQNPESLTCNGFTMALRRTSLSWRLSQPPVVIPKPKKVPPSKKQCIHNIQDEPAAVKHSENESVPSQDAATSPDTETITGEQNTSLGEGESQEITQSCPQRIEDSQSCTSAYENLDAGISWSLEGTPCEDLLSHQAVDTVSASPQECAPLPQRSFSEVTSQEDASHHQLVDLSSQVDSPKLSDPSPNPTGSDPTGFPDSGFRIVPELDLKTCMSLDESVYPTALIRFILAGTQPEVLDSKPQEETLKTTPEQAGSHPNQVLDATTSVLGQAFSTLPLQWGFPGANLLHGESLGKGSDSPEDLGAISMLNQQGTVGMDTDPRPDLSIFLPQPPNTVATYTSPPSGPEPHSSASCGLEVQGATPILTLDSGHIPQAPPNSELSLIPLAIAASDIQAEKQFGANLFPALAQGFVIAPENELQHAPLDLTQCSQDAPGKLEGGIFPVSTTSSADIKAATTTSTPLTPVTQAGTSSLPCKSTPPPTVERRKRKACGVCEPCQQKSNCGECTYCKNRKNSHQICKKRKCEVLKKKPEAAAQAQVRAAQGWENRPCLAHQPRP